MDRTLFWQSLIFAVALIAVFIVLSMTGVTREVPQIMITAAMAVVTAAFIVVMDKRQRET